MLKRKDIDLQISIHDDAMVSVDEWMIASILRNLTSNAIKFTAEGVHISIQVRPNEGMLQFEISDNGVGMTAEQVEAVLTANAVQSIVGTCGERGSGVGLMLIHQFLAKHGSKLEITSVVGAGTTASFVLAGA